MEYKIEKIKIFAIFNSFKISYDIKKIYLRLLMDKNYEYNEKLKLIAIKYFLETGKSKRFFTNNKNRLLLFFKN